MPPFVGTEGKDAHRGNGDDDTMSGGGGNDLLGGGSGSDTINGEEGDDQLRGGEGSDLIDGGTGRDTLFGHADFGPVSLDQWTSPTAGRIFATRISDEFIQPVAANAPAGDTAHLFVAELHTGAIRILDLATGEIEDTPFIDLDDAKLGPSGAQGLMGFCFDPDYADNGYVYLSIIDADGDTNILRFTRSEVDPLQLDPTSEQLIWEYPRNQPATTHTGGWIEFGPDGYLYMASGDGGPGGDPNNVAQNINALLGKIHRIDVHGGDDFPDDPLRNYAIPSDNPFAAGGGAAEVWAFGLRHPWRAGFDSLTGDLYIADVGQQRFEEINFQPAGVGGLNYGWSVLEGHEVFNPDNPGNPPPDDPSLVAPVLVYGRDAGVSITGGYVYRGPDLGLQGFYLYKDYGFATFGALRVRDGVAVDQTLLNDRLSVDVGGLNGIVSFAQDALLNLYAISLNGQVYRLSSQPGAGDGDDELHGREGNDLIYGGPGADLLFGGPDQDMLSGGLGADQLDGGAGNDEMFGNAGNDVAWGGAGSDLFSSGGGADILGFRPGDGIDRFLDFNDATDLIDLSAFDFSTAEDALSYARDLSNGKVRFDFGGGDYLVISNTTVADLGDLLIV